MHTHLLTTDQSKPRITVKSAWPPNSQIPLHWAAWTGSYEAARRLVAAGSDPDLNNSEGWSPLDIARRQQHSKVIMLLESSRS
jgi:ankyrin repeat protein